MTYSTPKSKKDKRLFGKPEEITNVIGRYLHRMGKPEQIMLTRLWQHWDTVMGPEIAALSWPLGHKDGILFVGGEDAMSVQELTFMHDEIIERANTFMDSIFFVSIKVRLSLDKTPLDEAANIPAPQRKHVCFGQALSGKYLKDMDPESAVAQCYARFVAFNNEKK